MRALEVARLDERVAATAGGAPLVACFVRKKDEPSQALLQAVDSAAAEIGGLDVVQIDIDADPARMDDLRVFKVPELIVWAGGAVVERTEGGIDAAGARDLLVHALDDAARARAAD